jgi:molybdopterin molybdotransferase
MLASIGLAQVPVIRNPRVVILSTGDELIAIDQPLPAGKIYESNSYMLEAMVNFYGGTAIRLPTAPDTLQDVRALFSQALAHQPDLIISSAGVSVGEADYVRTVLEELGQIDFWRINLRPGKPLAYGNVQGIPFFGLPGNPVSAMVTFEVITRPALLKLQGRHDEPAETIAILAEDTASDGRRSYHRVRLYRENGQLFATSTGTQSSGALISVIVADGLMIIPEDVKFVTAGTPMTVRLLRDI